MHEGEVGLFPNDPMAEEDLALFATHAYVKSALKTDRKIQAERFLWGLVYKAYKNTDYWVSKERAMEWFKKRVAFTMMVRDPDTKEPVAAPKSLTRISDKELSFLTDRIMDVICTEVMPGMTHNALRKQIEDMLHRGPG